MNDDLISRQAAQDYIAKFLSQFLYDDVREAVETIDEYIGDMPSVTPTVIDKIRAEIADKYMTATGEVNTVAKGCLQIIDKYRAESEE